VGPQEEGFSVSAGTFFIYFAATMQQLIHYFLHIVFPLLLAWFIDRPHWFKTYLILMLTMLVDLDHLLATPVFNPCRCSIGFHPLHSYIAIGIYCLLLIPRKTRVIGIGLLLHMLTDGIDCLFILRLI
jgi:hypothetical protein